jgi:hypothetical protein
MLPRSKAVIDLGKREEMRHGIGCGNDLKGKRYG